MDWNAQVETSGGPCNEYVPGVVLDNIFDWVFSDAELGISYPRSRQHLIRSAELVRRFRLMDSYSHWRVGEWCPDKALLLKALRALLGASTLSIFEVEALARSSLVILWAAADFGGRLAAEHAGCSGLPN